MLEAVSANHPRFLQTPDTLGHCWGGHPDAATQFRHGQARIVQQLLQHPPIESKRRDDVSKKQSEGSIQGSASRVLFHKCHLPLPRPGLCGAPLLPSLCARGSVVSHGERRRGLRTVAPALAHLCRSLLEATTHSACPGHSARADERLLLPGDLPHSSGYG